MTPWLGVLLILAISVLGGVAVERIRFRSFWKRRCTGPSWKGAFPDSTSSEIRAFLEMFVTAFAFRSVRKLAFEPSDRVMDIYRTRDPSQGWPDSLELETLAALARKRYGLDLESFWYSEITLGELFEKTIRRVA
jgi:hypothetical protein